MAGMTDRYQEIKGAVKAPLFSMTPTEAALQSSARYLVAKVERMRKIEDAAIALRDQVRAEHDSPASILDAVDTLLDTLKNNPRPKP